MADAPDDTPLETRLSALARTPTIDEFLAQEACRDAARRYSYGVDRLDPETMKSAYWPDAIDEHGRYVGDAHAFCDICMTAHDRFVWTKHLIMNHRVEIDEGGMTARGDIQNVSLLMRKDERILDTWYGRYLDTYECRDGEWRILRRVCVHDGDTSVAVPDDMGTSADLYRQGTFDRPAGGRLIGP